MPWTDTPEQAWKDYILPHIHKENWINEGADISQDIKLSKRELLGLIILAHTINEGSGEWLVGYDPADGEQNDGHITNGDKKHIIEHKIIVERDTREVLEAIKKTYTKFDYEQYGKDRTMLIHADKAAEHGGMVRISELKELIANESPFDRVFLVSVPTPHDNEKIIFHLSQHFPVSETSGLSELYLYFKTGKGEVSHQDIDWESMK